ncbi:Enoyl-[acyl-carrier-protein] reductase [NADH] FabI [Buchnera aphidicola (Cinara kochiana kochiana)]|uniref:Enoyl-[acyl-carrier-protein] reductase [NADH] n=1 Tax=Buchnera aphidicola (Cinara kochiana kochiana) TaxID=2518976 RepID=A0A451D5I8_9GAMM|nr:enoyl-ACP reductase [Buchnera aphidicola]VFP81088.1 Enoyl-[acyl-carrier-protein] reductase [NADH] FabI [Buchnera aphidicola (Cinara kochiana kochiana)]
MTFLKNKNILIFGVKNHFSIAWGIAMSMYKQKAKLAFVYHNVKSKKNIILLAEKVQSNIVLECDVTSDNSIIQLFKSLSKIWKKLDGIVHSIAYVEKFQLNKNYIKVVNRKNFLHAHEVNSFSLVAIAQAAKKFLNNKSAIITLSYIGAVKYVPYYNIMGISKASLEANVRYLAASIGKNIRVNAISAGPIKTTASYGIRNFHKIITVSKDNSLLHKNITIQEIGDVAAFLCSDLSRGITGQIIYVDTGNNIV